LVHSYQKDLTMISTISSFMKYITLILHLAIVTVKAQSVYPNSLQIQIQNDSLQTFAANPELVISLRCQNNSDKNLILYGFDSNLTKFGATVDRVCDYEHVGGGMALLIFNEKQQREYPDWHIPDSIDYKPMPKEKFEQRMQEGRSKYLIGTKVINGAGSFYVDQRIDLHGFSFEVSKTYYLQLIYYSGKSLRTKTVGEEQIEQDKKANNAELYQGCAISNVITFRGE
jgi:hypothetical protein